jgi:hypothetical protein
LLHCTLICRTGYRGVPAEGGLAMTTLVVQPMSRAEMDLAFEWAAAEGWNPGLDDADAFFAAAPGGFLVGALGDEPVTCISVVGYGEAFGVLGFHICRPDARGKGYGLETWNAGLARLGPRAVGLDGVPGQQENYRKSGFVLAHRNIRFGGPAGSHEISDKRIVEVGPQKPVGLAGSVAAYDEAFFPGPRRNFTRAWIAPPGRRTVAFVEENAVKGYGCIRPCRDGYRVGPLFADSADIADRLFAALTSRLRGADVYLDVPEPNLAAVALAGRHGLIPRSETARMYRGPAPASPLDRIYGITSPELG